MINDESGEFQYYAVDNKYPLLDEGDYYGECIDIFERGYEDKKKLYLRFKLFLDSGGEIVTETICMAFNIQREIGPRSKYYKVWTMIHRKEPSKNAQMSPRIFKNKFYKLRIRTSKKDKNGNLKPESDWYSIVDKILNFTKKPDLKRDIHFDY